MDRISRRIVALSAAAAMSAALAGRSPLAGQTPDLKTTLAAARQAAARNQQALRGYSWLEKTVLSFKGEVKNTKVSTCRYGPDGKVQKTPLVEPPAPEKQRGLRGRIVAKKTAEMKEELESANALVHQYVPSAPDMLQVVMNAGTASLSQAGPGFVALKFPGYLKAGDSLTLTFESALKTLRQADVVTWLDDPSKPVTLNVAMQSLPDSTSYPGSVVLAIAASQIEVRITNSNYQKITP